MRRARSRITAGLVAAATAIGVGAVGLSAPVDAGAPIGNPPTFSAVFTPNTIGPGSTSQVVFTITSVDATIVSDLAFSATLPSAISISTSPGVQSNCSGTVTAPAGGPTISLAGGAIAGFENCVVSVNVTSSTPGTHTLTTGDLTSNAGNSGTATDDLTVDIGRPGFTASTSPSSIQFGERATLTYIIDNTLNTNDLFSASFSVDLPTGITVADPTGATTTCRNDFAGPTAGASSVSYTTAFFAIFLNAGETCSASFDVVGGSIGDFDITTSDLTANGIAGAVNSGSAASALTVSADDVQLTKEFTDDPVQPGGDATLRFTILNRSAGSVSGISFTDDLDAMLAGAVATGLPITDVCGTGSTVSGTSTVSVSGGELDARSSCTFDVNVSVPASSAAGSYPNVTSALTTSIGAQSAASDTLFIDGGPQLAIEFTNDPVAAGDDVDLEFTLTNPSTTSAMSDAAFQLDFAPPLPDTTAFSTTPSPPCGSGSALSTITTGGERKLALFNGNVAAGGSCVFTTTITVPAGVSGGTYTFDSDIPTATIDGASRSGLPAADDLVVVGAPSLRLEYIDDPVLPGGTVTARYTVSHDIGASGSATAITFTDDLTSVFPSGSTATAPAGADPCGAGSTVSTSATDTLITLAAGVLAPGETCTFDVEIATDAAATPGSYNHSTSPLTATVAGLTATAPAGRNILVVTPLTFTKTFLDDPIAPGGSVTLEFEIQNDSPTDDATGIFFTDNLSAMLSGAAATSLPAGGFCGPSSQISGTSFLIVTDAAVTAGTSCSFQVTVSIPSGAAEGTYPNTASGSATVDGTSVSIAAADILTVQTPLAPIVAKSFLDDPVFPGDVTTLEFTITNDSASTASAISLTDDLDAMLTGAAATGLPVTDVCGTGSTLTGTSLLTLTGGELAGGASCTFTVSVAVPGGAAPDTYTNTTSAPTATVDGTAVTGVAASNSLVVADPVASEIAVTIDQASAQSDPTNGSPITFRAVFADDVTEFTPGDVTLSGTAGATTAVITGGPRVYDVAVSGMTSDGTVIASIAAGTVRFGATGTNAASTSTDNQVTYDTAGPSVTVEQAAGQADPTNAGPIAFDVVFSEPVTGLTTSDITLGGTAAGGIVGLSGSGSTYVATVTGMTSDGTVTISIGANAAVDAAGNGNAASTSTDNEVTFDTTAPTITIEQAAGQADPTNTGPIVFDVTVSEPVTTLTPTDFTRGGTAGGALVSLGLSGSGTSYTVTINGLTTDGTVTLSAAANRFTDPAGNGNTASTSIDNEVTFDTTAPTITIEQGASQADPTSTQPIVFDVTVSEAVTTLSAADFTVGGTATGGSVSLTGSGTAYIAEVSGVTTDGTVVLTLAANTFTDPAGNSNSASTSIDNEVTFDTPPPTVAVEQAAGQADPVSAGPVVFDVVFSASVVGFDETDVAVGGTATGGTVTVSGSGTTYTISVDGFTADGVVSAEVLAGAAIDAFGNSSLASTSVDNEVTVDSAGPTVTIDQAADQDDRTNELPIRFTVTFSEPVTGFTASDVDLAGTASGATASVTGSGASYEVSVDGLTADGTVVASVDAAAAVDAAGNDSAASTSTDNSVEYDSTAPALDVPDSPLTVDNDAGENGAVVSYTVTATDGGDTETNASATLLGLQITLLDDGAVVCSPASGAFFPIGDTTVTCTAQDDVGNVSTAEFVIRVADVEAPTFGAPPTGPVTVLGGRGVVNYDEPTATDNDGNVVPVVCDPPSGSTLNAGTVQITCTATDAAGNVASITFDLIVRATPIGGLPATGGGVGVAMSIGIVVFFIGLLLRRSSTRNRVSVATGRQR